MRRRTPAPAEAGSDRTDPRKGYPVLYLGTAMFARRCRSGLAIVIAAGLLLSTLGIVAAYSTVGPGAPKTAAEAPTTAIASAPEATSGGHGDSAIGLAHAEALEAGLRARGISPTTVHLPNFAGAVADTAQPIVPSYTQAPAPMGVADIGLHNVSGSLVPYALNTTSVAGTVNITNLDALYVDGDGPDTYGIQLNSVANGVTIFGDSSYEFWSQNYIDYTPSTEQLVFGDEVWNFSSPSGVFPTNSIYGFGPNGTYADFPYLYQGEGPTITIAYPFALTLYLNTSLIDDRPAFYFNYTVSNASFHQSASFDYLIFNSTVGTPSGPAPVPYYQADGYNYDPIGLINDMEIDILGNDDGDTTDFLAADATISLQYWNATAGEMVEVPSAYSAGQETGETSSGLLVYSSGGTNPIGIVRSGPGLVGGLWNYSGTSGAVSDTITVDPTASYAFLFVNPGATENASLALWVPSSTSGTTTFSLPLGGTFFLDVLLSGYTPAGQVVTTTTSVTLPTVHLVADAARGVYTPLFALNNAELAALSTSGTGTAGDPFVIDPSQPGSLAPQFAGWDDYLFPVFPGLLFAGTTAHVDVTPPSFEIDLPSWNFAAGYVAALGLPLTNDLQIQFYDASNISLVHAAAISGWMATFLFGYPESSVILWGCTHVLVASNTFDDQGNALLLYGGSGNTVWGNTFVAAPLAAANPSSVDDFGWFTGVNETESGDLLFNNYFSVALPAITPTVDPFPCDQYDICVPIVYTDTWNVSEEPATASVTVNGFALTGSIIGTSYQGGSYWSNYGETGNPYGVLPYNDSAAISAGGDFVPLVPFSLYPVTFSESGAPAGLPWNVTEGDVWISNSSTAFTVDAPNGTYALTVGAPPGYGVSSAPTEFSVSGAATSVDIVFVALVEVIIEENDLPTGWEWSATLNGTGTQGVPLTGSSTTIWVNLSVPAGAYHVTAAATDYAASPTEQTVTIPAGPNYGLDFVFAPLPATLDLTVTPTNASVWVNGGAVVLSHQGLASVSAPVGRVSLEALATGYVPYFDNLTAVINTTIGFNVTMQPLGTGTLDLAVTPADALVTVDGVQVSLAGGSYSTSLAVGVHAIVVTATGYLPYFNNVSIGRGATTSLTVALQAPTSSSSSSGYLGISSTGWALIAVLAVLAAAALVGLVLLGARRRGQGGGSSGGASPPSGGASPPPTPPSG